MDSSTNTFVLVGLQGGTPMVQRLREVGFFEGEVVVVRDRPPGGCVCLEVGGTVFALRKEEFECLQLREALSA